MNLQNWSPDTCKCVFEEKVVEGVVSFNKMLNKCPNHVTVLDEQVWNTVIDEQLRIAEVNKQVNNSSAMTVLSLEEKRMSKIILKILNKGNITIPDKILSSDKSVKHSFTGTGKDRVLEVELNNFTIQEKEEIKNLVGANLLKNKFNLK